MTRFDKALLWICGLLFVGALAANGAVVQDGKNYVGLSSDPTPTTATIGSRFYETDTRKEYMVVSAGTRSMMKSSVFYTQATPSISVTGTTNETTLYSVTIPGGSIGPSGTLEVQALFDITGSANLKYLRVYYGGVAIAANWTNTAAFIAYRQYGLMANDASETRQVYNYNLGIGGTTIATNVSAIDTREDQTLSVRGHLVSASDTITLRYVGITIKRGD